MVWHQRKHKRKIISRLNLRFRWNFYSSSTTSSRIERSTRPDATQFILLSPPVENPQTPKSPFPVRQKSKANEGGS